MAFQPANTGITASVFSAVVELPKNPDFTATFDANAFRKTLPRPTKTVIVTQDPSPGDFVPTGTPVTVTVVEKALIPSSSFTGLDQAVATKYKSIGDLEGALGVSTDAVATAAKTALDKGVAFSQLSAADKAAVTAFAAKVPGVKDTAKAASDISFLYQL